MSDLGRTWAPCKFTYDSACPARMWKLNNLDFLMATSLAGNLAPQMWHIHRKQQYNLPQSCCGEGEQKHPAFGSSCEKASRTQCQRISRQDVASVSLSNIFFCVNVLVYNVLSAPHSSDTNNPPWHPGAYQGWVSQWLYWKRQSKPTPYIPQPGSFAWSILWLQGYEKKWPFSSSINIFLELLSKYSFLYGSLLLVWLPDESTSICCLKLWSIYICCYLNEL